MAKNVKIPRASIVTEDGTYTKYIDDRGALMQVLSKFVTVIESGDAEPAQDSVSAEAEAPAAEAEQAEATPAQGEESPSETKKPKKTRTRTKESAQPKEKKTMATKAKKGKAASKAAPKTEASGVRTISGKAVNLDSYTKVKAPGGGVSYHCGDSVAEQLQGKDLDAIYTIAAKKLKVEEKELRSRFKHLNVGMQRMNLGNMLRRGQKAAA